MKKMKKLVCLLLTVVMVMALGVVAYAAEGEYKITIKGAKKGETYNAYKIFDVDVSADGKKFAYTIAGSSEWYELVKGYTVGETAVFTLTATAGTADEATDAGKVFIVTVNTDSLDAANFAAYLGQNLTGKTVAGTATGAVQAGKTDPEAEITVTSKGYYFVDTSLGSLCSLDTAYDTEKGVEIHEKNTVPTITKKVWEDSTGEYVNTATADVVDEIKYQLTVNTGTNSQTPGTTDKPSGVDNNYVIVDTMPEGFAYNENSLKITDSTTPDTTLWTLNTDYEVNWDVPNRTLTITLKANKIKDLGQNKNIVITYSAKVTNATAIQYGSVKNTNTVKLTYKQQESGDQAHVQTFEIGGATQFKKVDATDTALTEKPALQGVEFVLYKTENSATKYATVDSTGHLTGWTDADTDNATKLITNEEGTISVKGLDAGTYILKETKALDGYNALEDTITVTISDTGEVTYRKTNSSDAAEASIEVENKAGTVLPSTGGMGTTLFYIVGGILVIGAGVLLVTKRRMKNA